MTYSVPDTETSSNPSEGTRYAPSLTPSFLLYVAVGATYRRKLGVKEGAYLVPSDGLLEVSVSGTEYVIRKSPDGEVMGITHGAA